MEKTKKKAIEKLRQEMKKDCPRGYKRAIEMVADGSISLAEAEKLTTANNPLHEVFKGESEDFKKCFIAALVNILSDARASP